MKIPQEPIKPEHCASAKALNIPISTKFGVELSDNLRYKKTSFAKSFLEDVIALKRAVPFKKSVNDLGHKKGMAAGRFPQKAAKEFLKLVKSVEANAQVKGLNTSELKIIKIISNKASTPLTGGRLRRGTKRTHIEIVVRELPGSKKKSYDKKEQKQDKVMEKKADVPVAPVKPVEEMPVGVEETLQHDVPVDVEELQEKSQEKQQPEQAVFEKSQRSVEEPVTKPVAEPKPTIVKDIPLKEVSSSELLKQAQAKAAELNKKEKKNEAVQEVESLYDTLKQKGTLRGTASKPRYGNKGDIQ